MNSYEVQACNEMRLNTPGTIQGHGTLIAFDKRGTIKAAAHNTHAFGLPHHHTLIDSNLEAAIDTRAADTILDAVASGRFRTLNAFSINTPASTLAASVHQNEQNLYILELEPDAHPTHDLITDASAVVTELAHAPDIRQGLHAACDILYELTQFERIMAYKFDDDYNGQVIAEAKDATLPSFLGLSYPSSDIPKPAREAIARAGIRLVAAAHQPPVPIERAPDTDPIDLSGASLRGIAPIHVAYLNNMGVGASMSLAIHNAKRDLWGLIICHHTHAKPLLPSQRRAAAVVAQLISNHVILEEGQAATAAFTNAHAAARQLLNAVSNAPNNQDPAHTLTQHQPALTDIIKADGLAIISPTSIHTNGTVPTENELIALREWLTQTTTQSQVFHTPALGTYFTTSGKLGSELAGLLAFQLDTNRSTFAAFFRRQNLRSIRWAGDPHKASAKDAADMALHQPRDSFDPWHETIKGFAKPWTQDDDAVATYLTHALRPAFDNHTPPAQSKQLRPA